MTGPREPAPLRCRGLYGAAVQIGVLGPLEVRADAGPVVVPPGLPSQLLALLAMREGEPLSTRRIAAALWDEPPATAENLVQGYVAKLRRALGPDLIQTTARGYRVNTRLATTDAARFSAHLAAGRPRAALALWRGTPYADSADRPWAAETVADLERMRLDALEHLLEAEPAVAAPGLVEELQQLVGEHPFRERLWAGLVRGLYVSGRQADALAAYRRARELLLTELGVEPGPALRDAERAVLAQAGDLRPVPTPAGRRPPLTALVGRAEELNEVERALLDSRLVTIVGAGGAGKTALAVAVADRRDPPVWFVDLSRCARGDDVGGEVVRALGVKVGEAASTFDAAAAYLADRNALVVLDNCEHVIEAAVAVAEHLSAECPSLHLLATSREPLAMAGEVVLRLAGLDEDQAIRLLRARAPGAIPSEGPGELDAARKLVAALDGLPLAVEIAASSLAEMSLPELLTSVREGGRDLAGRRGSERHASLAAMVGWGVGLLDPRDADGLAAAAVFVGPFEADSLDVVAAGAHSAAPGLARRLTRRSLLVRDADVAGIARFRMLETVRAQLPAAAPTPAHVACHVGFAEAAAEGLRTGAAPGWMARVTASANDLRIAVGAAFESDPDAAARLVAALYWPWFLGGHLRELEQWAQRALDSGLEDDRLSARLWWTLSAARIALGDLAGSDVAASNQIVHATAAADPDLTGLGHSLRGMCAWARGDHAASAEHHRVAVEHTAGGDPWSAALVRALAARSAQGTPDGRDLLAAARRLAETTGEPMVLASCDDYAGTAAMAQGDAVLAMAHAASAAEGYEAVGYQEGIASAHALAGAAAAALGRWPDAGRHFEAALDVCRRLGHPGGIATALEGLGIVAAHTGRRDEARDLLKRAERERTAIGAVIAQSLLELHATALELVPTASDPDG